MKDIRAAKAPERVVTKSVKHKRRFCKVEGCTRIVKSQGLCQRHGAKPKPCKVPGCTKQSQGSFAGMCKAHFRQHGTEEQQAVRVTKNKSSKHVPIGRGTRNEIRARIGTDSQRQGSFSGEESTISSRSAVSEDTGFGIEPWEEPLFCLSARENEELAADLLGVFPEVEAEMAYGGGRVLAVGSLPSCTDYDPNLVSSSSTSTTETTDAEHSPYMDYYVHPTAAQESV